MTKVCPICGIKLASHNSTCPFCGATAKNENSAKVFIASEYATTADKAPAAKTFWDSLSRKLYF